MSSYTPKNRGSRGRSSYYQDKMLDLIDSRAVAGLSEKRKREQLIEDAEEEESGKWMDPTLMGTSLGASIGSFFPGAGTAIGAGIGAGAGALLGLGRGLAGGSSGKDFLKGSVPSPIAWATGMSSIGNTLAAQKMRDQGFQQQKMNPWDRSAMMMQGMAPVAGLAAGAYRGMNAPTPPPGMTATPVGAPSGLAYNYSNPQAPSLQVDSTAFGAKADFDSFMPMRHEVPVDAMPPVTPLSSTSPAQSSGPLQLKAPGDLQFTPPMPPPRSAPPPAAPRPKLTVQAPMAPQEFVGPPAPSGPVSEWGTPYDMRNDIGGFNVPETPYMGPSFSDGLHNLQSRTRSAMDWLADSGTSAREWVGNLGEGASEWFSPDAPVAPGELPPRRFYIKRGR